jgi:acylphosphatase
MVQGVGYRYFAMQNALRLGVCGYVRNLSNGDVEAYAEAAPAVLDQFRAELERGPSFSRVREVIEEVISVTGNYSSFQIRG